MPKLAPTTLAMTCRRQNVPSSLSRLHNSRQPVYTQSISSYINIQLYSAAKADRLIDPKIQKAYHADPENVTNVPSIPVVREQLEC
jgi:hypothetical protein